MLAGAHYEKWPTEIREIEQRYRDAPPAVLRVPTLSAFAGWKMVAWLDRGTARDLYDLWALSRVGALNDESARLFAKHGPTNGAPQAWMFQRAPTAAQWQAQLAAQTRLTVTADDALRAIRETWTAEPDSDHS